MFHHCRQWKEEVYATNIINCYNTSRIAQKLPSVCINYYISGKNISTEFPIVLIERFFSCLV